MLSGKHRRAGVKVKVKNFIVDKKGLEFDVANPKGSHIGDLYVDTKGLVWSKGKKSKATGVSVTWKEFIAWMESDGA